MDLNRNRRIDNLVPGYNLFSLFPDSTANIYFWFNKYFPYFWLVGAQIGNPCSLWKWEGYCCLHECRSAARPDLYYWAGFQETACYGYDFNRRLLSSFEPHLSSWRLTSGPRKCSYGNTTRILWSTRTTHVHAAEKVRSSHFQVF